MRVLGISGSLRRDSLNSALLRAAAERLPAGVELVAFERLRGRPALRRGRRSGEPTPEAVRELREAIRGADAVLVATPEYNHSIPGQLKNALDWASRPAGRERAERQAGGGDRRLDRHVRRGLGAGRDCARCWAPWAAAWSRPSCRWRTRTSCSRTGAWSCRPSSPSSSRRSSPSWSQPRARSPEPVAA